MEGKLCFLVSRGCLEGVYDASGKYEEGVWKVSDWPWLALIESKAYNDCYNSKTVSFGLLGDLTRIEFDFFRIILINI